MTLGSDADGWTTARAEEELQNVLADVRRGIWQPVAPQSVEAPQVLPTFDLLPVLRDELVQHRLVADQTGPDDPVFTTSRGSERDRNNIGLRVMRPVLKRADQLLAERGEHPLPAGVTAHKLRHTFASVLIALGRDPAYVMAQLGHADPGFTLRVYTHAMRRGEGDREALRALVEGRRWHKWAQVGSYRIQAAGWAMSWMPRKAASKAAIPQCPRVDSNHRHQV